MIRQLGVPTIFLTLSAAETRWTELLVILDKVLENKDITEAEAKEMSYVQRCDLIRADPVTCARYFDHRFRQLFKLLKLENGPLGEHKIKDSYCRVEFQHRGSPHIHALLWLDNAPVFDETVPQSRLNCEAFLDKIVTTCTADLEEYAGLQYHKHTKSCKRFRNDSAVCRFGIPFFPMGRTQILDPLDTKDLSDEEHDRLKLVQEKVARSISELDSRLRAKNKVPLVLSFEQFLDQLEIDQESYIQSIRSTLRRSQVFLKREPMDIRINGFNKEILLRHRANMDLQFVLDPYSCVHYILNYINKSNRGMSSLLRQVVEECKSGYMTHQQKLYKIASKFINCSEVSSQEAVYILLSMPLSMASRSSIFINTGEPGDRTKLLKSKKELEDLDPDSQDIMVAGLLDYYQARPVEMESIFLAEFAANFTYSKTRKIKPELDLEGNEVLVEDNQSAGQFFKLKYNKGWVQRRR